MIGRLTALNPEPQRNVKMAFSVDQVSCEISSPSGPVSCRDVAEFEISKLPIGTAVVLGLAFVTGCLMWIAWHANDAPTFISALVALPVVTAIAYRCRKAVLYRVFLLTPVRGKERVRFYATFSQIDVLLLMDLLTFWIGDRPRKLT